jgi:hydroxyacylglutathione hydrolase
MDLTINLYEIAGTHLMIVTVMKINMLMKARVLAALLYLIFTATNVPAMAAQSDRTGLKSGELIQPWLTGGPNCVAVPDWQVHEYNEDFYILRESGCVDAEKPFLYLIFGDKKALLEDTGVGRRMADGTRGEAIPTAPVILDIMAKWAARKHHAPLSLVVIHSHSHSDHTAADAQFQAMPGVQFIAPTPDALQKTTGIATWPTDLGKIDLGNRILDVIPIPGHDVASIALYDRATGNLLTGDSLYPGRLYVPEAQVATYAASADRLVDFVRIHPIAHVLGTHIEQGRQPYYDYPKSSTYMPEEHTLQLSRAHVFELADAFHKLLVKSVTTAYPDFSIVVVQKKIPDGFQAADGLGLQNGIVPSGWLSGGPNCVAVPDWQVHEYNEDFYILRESGCVDAEKPFLYLIFGDKKALLEDTGVGRRMADGTRGEAIPTAPVIQDIMARWAMRKHHAPVSLVVIHSHSHSDHTAGDPQFKALPNTEFIEANPAEIQRATGIAGWPDGIGHVDLGGRVIDVIPIPGHDVASIALYDGLTGNLMTGDSLYPGLLSVSQPDLAAATSSARRLADFASDHLVAHVLGAHIEQRRYPYLDYGRGTIYQPDEAPLDLTRAHIFELSDAFQALHGTLNVVAAPDFTIIGRGAATAYPK